MQSDRIAGRGEEPVPLAFAAVMAADKVTDREGSWYLRQWYDDERAVRLVSERAPAGTRATDLRPGHVEVENFSEDETLQVSVADLRAFVVWPPAEPEYEYRAVTLTGTYPSCDSEAAAKASLVGVGKFTRQHSAIWRRVKAVPAGEWERVTNA